jgi:hypothetical protein
VFVLVVGVAPTLALGVDSDPLGVVFVGCDMVSFDLFSCFALSQFKNSVESRQFHSVAKTNLKGYADANEWTIEVI